MHVNLTVSEIYLILDCIESKKCDLSFLRFCGGDLGKYGTSHLNDLDLIKDKLEEELLPFGSISAADVEASSQDTRVPLPKCTASNLDQREAGDEVSLDHHIQLYREVF